MCYLQTFTADVPFSTARTFTADVMLTNLCDKAIDKVYCPKFTNLTTTVVNATLGTTQTTAVDYCYEKCLEPGLANVNAFVAKEFDFTNIKSSWVTRSAFQFGFPLPGYKSANDRSDEQLEKIENFVLKFRKPLENAGEDGVNVLTNDYTVSQPFTLRRPIIRV